MDYIKFINEASFDEISYEISRLAKDTSKDAIENISLFLTHRIGDTFGKHEIPRLACRALIHKGKKGIEKMMSLLYEIKGFIYPTAIINSLWYAQNGELDPFPSGGIHIYPPLDSPPSPEVIVAAKNAFCDLVMNGFTDKEKFSLFVGFLYQQSCISSDCSDLMESVLKLITDSSIKITQRQIDEFATLIGSNLNEENYQRFLERNPVFINPLARKVIDKHKLGDDLITDFVVQTLNNNYVLVEIEKPHDNIFNAKDDFSASFIHAYGQVIDFLTWMDNNISYAQTKLPDIVSPNGLVIIGRSAELSPFRARKLEYLNKNNQRIKILTYDDILENARTLYRNIIRGKDSS